VASNYEDGDRPADEGGDVPAELPFRTGGTSHPAHTEARAELRDRETYYAELRFAVHCQSRSIPAPRVAPDDSAHDDRAHDDRAHDSGGTDGESWDEMIARFGDTWT